MPKKTKVEKRFFCKMKKNYIYRLILFVGLGLIFQLISSFVKAVGEEKKDVKLAEDNVVEEDVMDKKRQEFLDELKKVTVPAIEFTDTDIRIVIRKLILMTKVPIVLDEEALSKVTAGIPIEEKEKQPAPQKEPAKPQVTKEKSPALKITFRTVSPTPLLSLLTIALKGTGLGYKVEPNNYIWVSDPETLEREKLVTWIIMLKYRYRQSDLDIKSYLENALPPQKGRRIIFNPSGSLTITDTPSNLKRIKDLLHLLPTKKKKKDK